LFIAFTPSALHLSSSATISTFLPLIPPLSFISFTAKVTPANEFCPNEAPSPVSGANTPILIGSFVVVEGSVETVGFLLTPYHIPTKIIITTIIPIIIWVFYLTSGQVP
jgi:hypothetical protein